jgi:hypothetical protein
LAGGIRYLDAILNSIVLLLEGVFFEVTTTVRLYKIPVANPVIVTGLLKLVLEILLVKTTVLSAIVVNLVSIVTPFVGTANNLTSIFCVLPATAKILLGPGSMSTTTPFVAVKLGSTTTTGGLGVGGVGVSPPLLQANKVKLNKKM